MKKTAKKIFALSLAAAMTFSLAACGGSGSSDESGANANNGGSTAGSKHLNFGCYKYSDSIDPINNVNSSWCGLRYGVTECLFRFDDDLNVEYALCDEATTEDYKTWVLHIRDGVKFSNGNDLTPSAIKACFERAYKAEVEIKGASTPSQYVKFDSIEADDEARNLTLVCSEVTSNLKGILGNPFYAIIDTSVVDSDGVVGTGPYYVTKMTENTSIDLAKNENYWDGEVPYDTITAIYIEESSTKAMSIQSGDVDLVENITTPTDLKTFKEDDKYYVSTTTGVRLGNTYFNFNGALGNEALRQAIQYAIDDETACNVIVGGMYSPGCSVLPSSLPYGYENLTDPYTFNKEQAIKTLDDAGIVDTDGDGYRELDGKNIDLNYLVYTSRNLPEFAEAARISLDEIGVKCTITTQDYDTALANQRAGKFDMITANSLTVQTGDPTGFLGNWYSENSEYYGFYKSDEYDAAYKKLLQETDETKRVELITELQQILIDDAATLIHGYYNSTMISIKDRVTGADIAPMDFYWITTDIKPAN